MVKTTLKSIVVLLLLVPALAHGMSIDIPGSKHDLSAGSSSSSSACYVCHIPHFVMGQAEPLWSSKSVTERFTQYNSNDSGYAALKDDGGVMVCVGCHDGTFAELSIYVEASMNPEEQMAPGFTGQGKGPGPDHPVNIVYFDYESDQKIRPAISNQEVSDGKLSLALYNGRVQCGSCHDVHKGQGEAFLRISNEGSQLCLVCHLK